MTRRVNLELFTLMDSAEEQPVLKRLATLELEPGDVLVFRGDCIHAGAKSERGHFGRLHCYLDNPAVARLSNSTDMDLPPLSTAAPPKAPRRKATPKAARKKARKK